MSRPRMRRLRPLIVLLAVFVGVAATSAFSQEGRTLSAITTGDVTQWTQRIKEVGSVQAYTDMARAIEGWSLDAQHAEAHRFGAALFAAEGARGLSTCDGRFSYGCFHEFLGQAIQSLGLEVVNSLNEGCIETLGPQWLSCQHGIGHGIIASVGYDDEALREALGVCERIPKSDPIGGCYGGVFMEYNMRTMLGVDASPRMPVLANLVGPCDSLAYVYLRACYYWQPQWWATVLGQGHGDEQTFSRMGILCAEAPDRVLRHSCFEGIGNITARAANYSPEETIALCAATSPRASDQLFCRSAAANSFTVTMPDRAVAVCDGLEGEQFAFCTKYAVNEGNSLNVIEEPLSL